MNGDCISEMSDCSSLEEGEKVAGARRNLLSIRLDRRARRLESNNRERRRMHELNAAFQVGQVEYLAISQIVSKMMNLYYTLVLAVLT